MDIHANDAFISSADFKTPGHWPEYVAPVFGRPSMYIWKKYPGGFSRIKHSKQPILFCKTHGSAWDMRTNIVMDDKLMERPKLTGIKTKGEVVHEVLRTLLLLPEQAEVRNLRDGWAILQPNLYAKQTVRDLGNAYKSVIVRVQDIVNTCGHGF